MRRLPPVVALALSLTFVATACGGDDSGASAKPGVVAVEDNVFTPKSLEVKAGDTVTWEFTGNSAHNVTFDDVNSKLMKDGTFEHTFDEAGSFAYRCTVHTGMTGKVVVT